MTTPRWLNYCELCEWSGAEGSCPNCKGDRGLRGFVPADQSAPTETLGKSCDCGTCWVQSMPGYMVVCKTCGNKRCPKATNHAFRCTCSNDVGQVGEPDPRLPHALANPPGHCPRCEEPLPTACDGEGCPMDEPQGAPRCEYHPIYRECVWCGGAMNRGDDLECPGQSTTGQTPEEPPSGAAKAAVAAKGGLRHRRDQERTKARSANPGPV